MEFIVAEVSVRRWLKFQGNRLKKIEIPLLKMLKTSITLWRGSTLDTPEIDAEPQWKTLSDPLYTVRKTCHPPSKIQIAKGLIFNASYRARRA